MMQYEHPFLAFHIPVMVTSLPFLPTVCSIHFLLHLFSDLPHPYHGHQAMLSVYRGIRNMGSGIGSIAKVNEKIQWNDTQNTVSGIQQTRCDRQHMRGNSWIWIILILFSLVTKRQRGYFVSFKRMSSKCQVCSNNKSL